MVIRTSVCCASGFSCSLRTSRFLKNRNRTVLKNRKIYNKPHPLHCINRKTQKTPVVFASLIESTCIIQVKKIDTVRCHNSNTNIYDEFENHRRFPKNKPHRKLWYCSQFYSNLLPVVLLDLYQDSVGHGDFCPLREPGLRA